MGKSVSATDMLNAGRRRPPTRIETGTEQLDNTTPKQLDNTATRHLDAETSSQLDDQTARQLDVETTRSLNSQSPQPLDDQSPEPLNVSTTSAVDAQATKRLDDQVTEQLSAPTTSALGTQESQQPDVQTTEQPGTQASRQLDVQSGSGSGGTSETYQRSTVFLTPDQRQWIRRTAKNLPDGLSGSDIMRLAVSRLAHDVSIGLDLVSTLSAQAHSDAEIFAGRRNRGLPPRMEISA